MASGFHRKTNPHNFWYITPNSIFETSIESSEDKEQTLKFSIQYEQNSLSYIQSQFSPNPHTHTPTNSHAKLLIRDLLSNFFPMTKVEMGHICPYLYLTSPMRLILILSISFESPKSLSNLILLKDQKHRPSKHKINNNQHFFSLN